MMIEHRRSDVILQVRDLTVQFRTDTGPARAVDRVSFDLYRGETLGLVGESGCGKTVTALTLLRLIQQPQVEVISGEVLFEGKDLLSMTERDLRAIRGNQISMIFQEPMSSLNPVFRIGDQIGEAILAHERVTRKEARRRVVELLHRVGIPDGAQRYDSYPHELSGGMRQRVLIAMALACNPSILIADEPTTALDVTIQAQILQLISRLQKQTGMSVLIITHDLGVIAQVADRIAIMYASKIVENGRDRSIFFTAKHPYTLGLLESIPRLTMMHERLHVLPGAVPDPTRFPAGCHFSPRCTHRQERCLEAAPELEPADTDHQVACWEWKNLFPR